MDLKAFVSTVLLSVEAGVDEARSKSTRDIYFANNTSNRTVEFDIAVSAEEKTGATGKAGIRVLQFAEGGGNISKDKTNSTISRIKFGIDISHDTKKERADDIAATEAYNSSIQNPFDI